MGRGDSVHHHRAAAERVGLEPNSPQLLAMRLEGVELLIGQLQGEWEQEPLGRRPHTAELDHDGFVEHPLVGGMLIHDDHAIRTLVHDVAVEHLDQRDLEASLRLGLPRCPGASEHPGRTAAPSRASTPNESA